MPPSTFKNVLRPRPLFIWAGQGTFEAKSLKGTLW
jgi:hypothetical protein